MNKIMKLTMILILIKKKKNMELKIMQKSYFLITMMKLHLNQLKMVN